MSVLGTFVSSKGAPALIGEEEAYGGALIARLDELCLAPDGVDVGMTYRTLRELEGEGLLASRWFADDGAPRRTYRLTATGRQTLDEWTAVMRERGRLVEAFLGRADRLPPVEGG
jgi:DNA-binding PadR family transcriptional regulator